MGKAVIHMIKGKSSSGALGSHIDRTPGRERSFKNADLERTHLNKSYYFNKHSKLPLNEAISSRIAEGYKGKVKLRKDAVRSVNIILSGSHEDMIAIFKDPIKKDAWIKKNAAFAAATYGIENVVRFVVHEDEKTPHIHLVIVPFTQIDLERRLQVRVQKKKIKGTPEDRVGRLSAKVVMGNRFDFLRLHTEYAQYVKEFGLERGEKWMDDNAKNLSETIRFQKHQPTREWKKEQQKIHDAVEKVKNSASKSIKSISPRDRTKILEKVLEGEKVAEILKLKDYSKQTRERKQ